MRNDNGYHNRSRMAQRSTIVSVVVNFILSCIQVITGLFSGSQGLIADGIHSLSDLIADFVVLFAKKKAVTGPLRLFASGAVTARYPPRFRCRSADAEPVFAPAA